MYRRHGMEGVMGIGGGVVSAESQKNLDIGEDLIREHDWEGAASYLLKATEDPNNLRDAILKYSSLCKDPQRLIYLKLAERRGRTMLQSLLGDNCFKEGGSVGDFWSILSTRPYMRVLRGLDVFYLKQGNYEEAWYNPTIRVFPYSDSLQ